jgi:hypothetical protein
MPENDLFAQINNAVLDLQSAELQSYDRPLKRLAGLLRHSDLASANEVLTKELNLDRFLDESARTQGGMAGSARLDLAGNPGTDTRTNAAPDLEVCGQSGVYGRFRPQVFPFKQ